MEEDLHCRKNGGRTKAIHDRNTLLGQLTDAALLNAYPSRDALRPAPIDSLTVLGHYRVLGSIGSGGNGVVFEAEHLLMRRKVAVKVLPVNAQESPLFVTRFLREMRAVARLNHPNIVAAFDAGICPGLHSEDPDLYYFVMEHLAGQDLEHLVEGAALPIAEACALIYQVASALDEAHRHQLVHRDIKPSNVFVTQNRQAKLLDFGLVRHLLSDGFTTPDAVVGTIEYMAPEQAADATDVDIRTDLFGLGATLFYALTGRSPFPVQGSWVEAILCRQNQQALAVRSLRPEVPAELEAVLQRMLALDPEERYPNAQGVMHALLPFLANHACRESARMAPTERNRPNAAPVSSPDPAPRILIVDAHARTRRQLGDILGNQGWECVEAGDAASALQHLRRDPTDAVLLAVQLPDDDGHAALSALRENPPCPNLKVLMIAPQFGADEMATLLRSGADDYLPLSIGGVQIAARVKAALKHKALQDRTDQLSRRLLDLNAELERSLSTRTTDLVQARNALVLALARPGGIHRSAEVHRASVAHAALLHYPGPGSRRASSLCRLDRSRLHSNARMLCAAARHRQCRAARSNPAESRAVGPRRAQNHADTHHHRRCTLQNVAHRFGAGVQFLHMAIDIARNHHENYDGTGYPDRLAGSDIPLAARILAIADAYDALRSRRAQRPGLSHVVALQILLESSAGKFGPYLLAAFQRSTAQFERIFREQPDSINID